MAKLFKVEHIQRLQGQDLINRYFYLDTTGAFTSKDMAEGFAEFMVPEIKKVQSLSLEHVAIRVKEQVDTMDSYVLALSGTIGERTGEFASVFLNWAFQLFPAGSQFRTGRKAITGISEGDQTDGEADSAMQTILETLQPFFADKFTDGTNFLIPVLARYVIAADVWKIAAIKSALYKRISTQNTRKPYSGGGDIPIVAANDLWTWVGGVNNYDKTPTNLTGLQAQSTYEVGTVNIVTPGAGTTWN